MQLARAAVESMVVQASEVAFSAQQLHGSSPAFQEVFLPLL